MATKRTGRFQRSTKAVRNKSKKGGRGGARRGSGRKRTPLIQVAEVEIQTRVHGSRKAACLEVAKSYYPRVACEKGAERARKAHKSGIKELRAAERSTPEAIWATPLLGDDDATISALGDFDEGDQ